MTMDSFRMLIGFQHKFKSCSAEKGKPLWIIMVTIVDAPVKEISFGMRLNEETLSTVNETKKDRAMNLMVEKRYPEII
jgi:hypothetical protein